DGVGLGLAAHHGRSKRGAGLGLAVCRRAVRALGGGIRMSAPSGGGTAVEITLPDTTRPFRVSGGE
ncbi:MAG: HAMP domain-containing histidine kinase, partial [Alphaproteobacteria bacterium]|nr:HAMP domain-containing histidine kinase [Alphaproteobacteria bacterium]